MSPGTTRSRRTAALFLTGTVALGGAVVGLSTGTAEASSHREAPLISGDPLGDNTDTYAFVSPDDPESVTLIANWIPLQEPNGGPIFYPWGTTDQGYYYDIKIDNNGDAVPDLTYRWTFTTNSSADRGTPDDFSDDTFLYADGVVNSLDDENLIVKQTYDITVSTDDGATFGEPILADAPVAPSNIGPGAMPNYDEELFAPANVPVTTEFGEGRSYVGQADDPFFLDLRVFDLLYGGDLSERGVDTLSGYNVNTIALQVPKAALALDNDAAGNPVIGIWSTTDRESVNLADGTTDGNQVQVSRLGNPLVNEVVVPTTLKDAFNAGEPANDGAAADGAILGKVLEPEVPQLIELLYEIPAAPTPRTDLAEIFLLGITDDFDGAGVYASLGDPEDTAPIGVDLNSLSLNAGVEPGEVTPAEMLRLNMSITAPTSLEGEPLDGPSSLGVVGGDIQGFPNGRRLADDVVDISLVAVGGQFAKDFAPDDGVEPDAQAQALAEAGGDQVGSNDREFGATFPYIASPNNQSVNQVNAGGDGQAPPPDNGGGDNGGGDNGGGDNGGGDNGSGVQMPVGGVETGAGGMLSGDSALPLVSGGIALVLLGAGGASLYSQRRRNLTENTTTSE